MSSLRRMTLTHLRLRTQLDGGARFEPEPCDDRLEGDPPRLGESDIPPVSIRSSWGGISAVHWSSASPKWREYCQPSSASTPGWVTSRVQSELLIYQLSTYEAQDMHLQPEMASFCPFKMSRAWPWQRPRAIS